MGEPTKANIKLICVMAKEHSNCQLEKPTKVLGIEEEEMEKELSIEMEHHSCRASGRTVFLSKKRFDILY